MENGRITSLAFIWSRVLCIPFWTMLSTLSVILYKEFHASPFLITCLIALKPASALVAAYWSAFFRRFERLLVLNIVLSSLLRFVPFLLFFFVSSPWFIVTAFALYMSLSRGSVPAWMELFKNHIPKESQPKVLSFGNTIEYIGTTLFPLLIGVALDLNGQAWRVLFPLTALAGLSSLFFLVRLPPTLIRETPPKNWILPWRRSYELIRDRPDYRRYVGGVMLGGAGLMILQPILPYFFVDVLDLSYTEMILALTVCKGIGFTLTSPFWTSLFRRKNLFAFSAIVILMAALFPLCLLSAQWTLLLVYAAYLLYGVMQSGSELSWHMSAVDFAQEGESLVFSETNILAVGLRGCIIPFVGHWLFVATNSLTVMCAGSLLCLFGSYAQFAYSRKKAPVPS